MSSTLLVRRTLLAIAAWTGIAGTSLAQSPDIPGWRLVWSDEFNGGALDASRWNAENVAWPYNAELEYYLPQQATVQDGQLSIRAERRSYGGRAYVSARINTAGHLDQQYGRFEARMWVPGGQGYWPAFWLLPSSQAWPPEIDIMETIGSQPNKVYLTHHFGTVQALQSNGTTWTGPDFTAGYHRFAVEWSPTRVDWFVDGVQRFSTTANFPQEPMYVILNMAIGGNLPGNPTAATVFPKCLMVDWVRVYQRDMPLLNPSFESTGAGASPANWTAFGNAQQADGFARSGAKSVRVAGIGGAGPFYSGVFQDLPASPGQVWRASVFGRHTGASRLLPGETMYVKIEWNNASGGQISFEQSPVLTDTSPLDTPMPGSVTATAPPGTATARVTLVLVQNSTGSGAAYMDDVTFGYTTPGVIHPCVADFDGINGPNLQDIFGFLAAWFDGDPHADFDESGTLGVLDIFSFLAFWFQGCS